MSSPNRQPSSTGPALGASARSAARSGTRSAARSGTRSAAVSTALSAALSAALACASAQAAGPAVDAPALERWIGQSAAATWSSRSGDESKSGDEANASAGSEPASVRVEVRVGRLNPSLRLAPCARVEPFLPPNARLWGRGYVGVRCAEGASWTTMMPVTVSVFGPALIAAVPMAQGIVPDARDFRIEEVDWTRSARPPVSDPAQLAGRSLGRPLSAGQVLHASDLRIPQTFSAGDPVRIRVVGSGFTVSASGYAMAAAGEGQSLRVRTETGRMLVGTVRERTVEVTL